MSAEDTAREIKLLALDVDGIFTNGCLWLNSWGEELKCFNFSDINGVTLASMAGLKTVLITGEQSKATAAMARKLRGATLYQKVNDKLQVMKKILSEEGLSLSQVAYLGDDLNDLPLLQRAGFSATVANAPREVRQAVHYVTQARGGEGAVREAITFILKSQGIWEKTLAVYLDYHTDVRVGDPKILLTINPDHSQRIPRY